jgi:hypothetical protein
MTISELNPVIDILEAQYPVQDDAELSRWYNEVHLPILIKSDKVQSIARYKVLDKSSQIVRYIIICKYNSQQDFEEFRGSQEFKDAGNDKPVNLADKIPPARPIHCELVKEWRK